MTLNFVTLEKSLNATPSNSLTHHFNSFCLAIRLTDSLKATELLSERITAFLTPTNSSQLTFTSEMTNSPSALPSGLQARASYQCALSSSNTYVIFSTLTLPDNLYELEAPLQLQRMEFPLQSFRPSVDGLPTPSRCIYKKTLSSSRHSCLDKPPTPNLPLSTLWNPDWSFTDFSQFILFYFDRLFLNRLPCCTYLWIWTSPINIEFSQIPFPHTYLWIWTSHINTDLHFSFSLRSSPCSSHCPLCDLITLQTLFSFTYSFLTIFI